ncbi:MAG: bifunctional 2-polyprenyl-6-hydroxyphenol methylase/3-demethylubiquinol 3-O-methyltransferase UbiG [Gammaproteobacteria bacterium]
MTTNSTPMELEQFNNMAHDWWDLHGPCKALHQMNPVRLAYIQQHAPLRGQKVLDVGCGGGILSEAMAKAGAEVTALELANEVIAVARAHAQSQGLKIDYQMEPVEAHAATHPGQYDVVTCLEMLEHVPEPASVIRAIHTLLKPDGIAFFSTLNRHPMAFIQAIVGAEYVLKLLPKGTHSYRHFIKPSELDAELQAAGLKTKHIQGMGYNPLTEQFYLKTDVSVNYLMCALKYSDQYLHSILVPSTSVSM